MLELWAMEPTSLKNLKALIKTQPSAFTFFDEDESPNGQAIKIVGGVASFEVKGVLSNSMNFMSFLFGGGSTSYKDICRFCAEAEGNDKVKSIEFLFSSGGGHLEGLHAAAVAIANCSKPTVARVSTACSAAYALAAQCKTIEAVGPMASVGSVGIVYEQENDKEYLITITNTESKDKRPDVTTDEGQAVVREFLDAMFGEFVTLIASGRGTTNENVIKGYGKGRVLIASDAKAAGMLDTIVQSNDTVANVKPKLSGGSAMNLDELKATHPGLYAQVFELGLAKGVGDERARASAFLEMGAVTGDLTTVAKGIKDGEAAPSSAVVAMIKKQNELIAGLSAKNLAGDVAADAGAQPQVGAGAPLPTASADEYDTVIDQVLASGVSADLGLGGNSMDVNKSFDLGVKNA